MIYAGDVGGYCTERIQTNERGCADEGFIQWRLLTQYNYMTQADNMADWIIIKQYIKTDESECAEHSWLFLIIKKICHSYLMLIFISKIHFIEGFVAAIHCARYYLKWT